MNAPTTAFVARVMRSCKNYFERERIDGDFSVYCGCIDISGIDVGDYIAIVGSDRCDGLWVNGNIPDTELDKGRVYRLHPPISFLALCDECEEYDKQIPITSPSSESFGEYSYNRTIGSTGTVSTWQAAFRDRLNDYRKPYSEVIA